VDGRCDLFSLGCVLYRLATGRPPFRGRDVIAALVAAATETPPPPTEVLPGLPAGFSGLVMQMLEKDPAKRPASAAAVAASLATIEREWATGVRLREESAETVPKGSRPELGSSATRRRTAVPEARRTQTGQRPPRNRVGAGVLSPLGWALVAGGGLGVLAVLVAGMLLLGPGKDADRPATTKDEPETARQDAEQSRDNAHLQKEAALRKQQEAELQKQKEAALRKQLEAEVRKQLESEKRARPQPVVTPQPAATPHRAIRLRPLSRVAIYPGKSKAIVVELDRDGVEGPVVINVDKLPAGVTAASVIMPAKQNKVEVQLTAAATAAPASGTAEVHAVYGDQETQGSLDVALTRPPGEVCCLTLGRRGPVAAVALSADRKLALVHFGRTDLRLWDLGTAKEIRPFHEALDADHRAMLAALPPAERGKYLKTFSRGPDLVRSLAFSPDGRLAVSVPLARDAAIVWDVGKGAELFRAKGSLPWRTKRGAVFSPNGKTLLVYDEAGSTVHMWDVPLKRWNRSFKSRGGVSLAFSADGQTILGGGTNEITLWSLAGKVLRQFETVPTNTSAEDVAISSDGGRAFIVARSEPSRVWDVKAGKPLRTIKGERGEHLCVAISPDGQRGLTGDDNGNLRYWDLDNGKELRCFEGHTGRIARVELSQDGRFALTGSADGTARLWDLSK
jgi:WD40 repeat protein